MSSRISGGLLQLKIILSPPSDLNTILNEVLGQQRCIPYPLEYSPNCILAVSSISEKPSQETRMFVWCSEDSRRLDGRRAGRCITGGTDQRGNAYAWSIPKR